MISPKRLLRSLAAACAAGITLHAVAADFHGDGINDLVWRDPSTGKVTLWRMAAAPNAGRVQTVEGGWVAGNDWKIAGYADFTRDGKSEIVWRNEQAGGLGIWVLNGTAGQAPTSAGYWSVPAEWKILGIADFTGDGSPDILWRNDSTGYVGIWVMNGVTTAGSQGGWIVGSDWAVQGVGDFNGDGKADILWRHSSGSVGIWLMNGSGGVTSATLPTLTGDWVIGGVGDTDGDRRAEIVLRQPSTGAVNIWRMQVNAVTGALSVASNTRVGDAPSNYLLYDFADVTGDGKADLVWYAPTTGSVGLWVMNGAAVQSTSQVQAIVSAAPPPQTTVMPSSITLYWDDNSSTEQGFAVERSANGTSGWAEVGRVAASVATFADRTVAKGATYFYRVKAYNATQSSAYSNVFSAKAP
jgi:FG-GAP-like repeat